MVDVPELAYLMADGAGDPGAAGYRATVQALYRVAYTIRSALKHDDGVEYRVMPLQGRWWLRTGARSSPQTARCGCGP
jgi:hypothetical protein